jgi:hypothetical protein
MQQQMTERFREILLTVYAVHNPSKVSVQWV